MAAPESVDAYLAPLGDRERSALAALRDVIRAVVPDARETIAYAMPTFRDAAGRMVVSYAAFRDHYSLFPLNGHTVEALGDAVRPYAAGKGTMRFGYDEPLPVDLVRRVVEMRVAENAAKKRASGGA